MTDITLYRDMEDALDLTPGPKISDFAIGKPTFEVGDARQGKRQIQDLPDGIVVRDDVETAHLPFVPLWQFGLTY